MSVINTNYLALVSQNNLQKSQNALGTAIERLSSGMRINSAKDDAAGQAIANRFTANIKGLTQATRNANDGISIAQTTEGSLNEINNNLQRIRELTVQAANGSNSDSDLESIQAEIQQRLDEIDRVSQQTQFNGVQVLGEEAATLNIQVGANDGQTISISLREISSKTLSLDTFQVSTSFNAKPSVELGDAIEEIGGAAPIESIEGEVTAGDLAVTVALEISNVSAPSGESGTLEGFVQGDDNAYYAMYNDGSDGMTAYAVTADEIADNGAIDLDGVTAEGTLPDVGGNPVAAGDASDDLTASFDVALTEGTIDLGDDTFDSFVQDGDGAYYAKSEEGNYYQINTSSIGLDGTVDLDASAAPQAVSIVNGAGNTIEGTLHQVSTGYAVAQEDGTLLAVEDVDPSTGEVTIKEATYADADGNEQTIAVKLGGAEGDIEYVTIGDKHYAASDVDGVDLQANPNALEDAELNTPKTADPLAALDNALQQVDDLRSHLGAIQNRFESTIANLNNTITNLSSARSRIEDADYAVEVSNMTRAQILQQAGTSVLAQANQVPQTVLSLLR